MSTIASAIYVLGAGCGGHLRFLSLVAAMAAPFFALLFPIYIKFPILLLLLLLLLAVVRISRSTKRERKRKWTTAAAADGPKLRL
jgi:membrane protein implicated in regulation of membrane protease activity